jgi:hypothetical protein
MRKAGRPLSEATYSLRTSSPAQSIAFAYCRVIVKQQRGLPNYHCSISQFLAGDSRTRLLRYHNRHLLFRRPSPAILSNHDNRMFPRQQRLREVMKSSIPRDIWHRLSIDD